MSLLTGSVALLAISGVNAGPCRPLSSFITSGLEVATTSTEVSESTATLASTLTTEIEVSETLSATVSTTEGVTTTAETTTITADTTTTEATTTEAAITTEAPTTTTETTTALATTSAEPIPQPRHDCSDLANPYTAPSGEVFNIACNTDVNNYLPDFLTMPGNFEACLLQCAESSTCSGVEWVKASSYCITFTSFSGTVDDAQYDIAFKVSN